MARVAPDVALKGGLSGQYDVHKGGGGDGKVDEYGQGEGGGQKSRKFCGRHMYMAPYISCINLPTPRGLRDLAPALKCRSWTGENVI